MVMTDTHDDTCADGPVEAFATEAVSSIAAV